MLPDDAPFLQSERSGKAIAVFTDWQTFREDRNFERPGDRRLHLGLLPQPYFGDLARATVFILLLNPGMGSADYYGEYEVPKYREALLATIRQDMTATSCPFLFLDPRFGWHGGFDWWNAKLAGLIEALKDSWNLSFAEARAALAHRLASIELLPYHSPSFRDADGWMSRLPSVKLAKQFVLDTVIPRVRRNEAILIVTRKVREWGLVEEPGLVCYNRFEARGAHISRQSRGGGAILDFLKCRSPE